MGKRNKLVDIIRGLAMLMVVLGHTISGSSINFESSFLFQVIWTLQMPLFILISGYVTRFSKPILNAADYLIFLKKRTLAYMLPWAVWTFLIRGIIFCDSKYTDLKFILWNMDSGYWFLATIWTISLFFGFTEFVISKFSLTRKKDSFKICFQIIGSLICMCIIGLIGFKMGLNFFGIKLTLYYFPFYLAGYLYGQLQEKFRKHISIRYFSVFTGLCLILWIYLINRVDFYSGKDEVNFIILRFFTSLIGCISITSLIAGYSNSLRGGVLEIAGVYSLNIYVAHYLCLNIIHPQNIPVLDSMSALFLILINYTITLMVVYVIIQIARGNRVLNQLLFYKT